jgi:hypothetical protein
MNIRSKKFRKASGIFLALLISSSININNSNVSEEIKMHITVSRSMDSENMKNGVMKLLEGIWSGDPAICEQPEITIGSIALVRDGQDDCYYAYGIISSGAFIAPNVEFYEMITVSGASATAVDHGLLCFVHDDKKKCLILRVPNKKSALEETVITLFKGEGDAVTVTAMRLPMFQELVQRLRTGRETESTSYLYR